MFDFDEIQFKRFRVSNFQVPTLIEDMNMELHYHKNPNKSAISWPPLTPGFDCLDIYFMPLNQADWNQSTILLDLCAGEDNLNLLDSYSF